MTDRDDIQLLSIADLRRLPEPEWLIDNFIHKGDVAVIYGPASSGKSFLALDWALTLAADKLWLDKHKVACAPVIYMAGEGGPSIYKRIEAWLAFHELRDIDTAYFHLKPLPLREEEAIASIEQTLEAFDHKDGDYGMYPGLLVVDTLSQFFSGGDEVSPDMTQFVTNMRRLARNTGAAVLIVHHTNKGGKSERGHTSLRCNVEVMFQVQAVRDKSQIIGIKLVNDKQKDDPEAKPVTLMLEPSKRSLVIARGGETPEAEAKPAAPKQPSAESMVSWLAARPEGATFTEWMLGTRVEKNLFIRRRAKLLERNQIYKTEAGRYHIMPTVEDVAGAEDDPEEG